MTHDEKVERTPVGDRIVIYRRGKKGIYTASFFDGAKHNRKSLKTGNKNVAMKRALELAARLNAGDYHTAPPVTVKDTSNAYLAYQKTEGRARRTLVRYTGELTTFAEYAAQQGVTKLSKVTMALLDGYRAERLRDHDPATVYHETMVILQLFRWAKKRQMLATNPLTDYETHKPPRKHKKALSFDQVKAILGQCSTRQGAKIATLAMTGIRAGELQGLRRDDVDLTEGWITVAQQIDGPTKTRNVRRIPIHPALKGILVALPRHKHEYFFTSEPSNKYPQGGHWINTKHLCDYFKAAAKRAGVEGDFTPHSLRHFLKSFAVNSGVPDRVVDVWMGHSDGSVRGLYYHLKDEESKKFMDSLPFNVDRQDNDNFSEGV